MKILTITILLLSSFTHAEKYEMPSFNSQFDKSVSFKEKVRDLKKPQDWTSKYQLKDSDTEKSKRLPSSKNSTVKFWDYKKKK